MNQSQFINLDKSQKHKWERQVGQGFILYGTLCIFLKHKKYQNNMIHCQHLQTEN